MSLNLNSLKPVSVWKLDNIQPLRFYVSTNFGGQTKNQDFMSFRFYVKPILENVEGQTKIIQVSKSKQSVTCPVTGILKLFLPQILREINFGEL